MAPTQRPLDRAIFAVWIAQNNVGQAARAL